MKRLNRLRTDLPQRPPERILQFGGGNFLRGFVDWMFDVLNKQNLFNGSVVVIKPTEKGDYEDLNSQNGLFHVILDGIVNGKQVTRIDLVQSVSRTIHPYKDWAGYLATARDPGMRYIVSNTTEAGIAFSDKDQFNDEPPGEFPAKLTRWLYERYRYFSGSDTRGCIILPCELIQRNGEALLECVIKYIDHWGLDRKFEKWILNHNYFYNTLVDRIVSGYPHDRASEFINTIGYDDNLMVAGELYHSWIISGDPVIQRELRFTNADLNVRFVEDISGYSDLKVRVLNGAHTALVPVGYLAGYKTIDACMEDEQIRRYLEKLLDIEVKSTMVSLTRKELNEFIRAVLDRFRNPVLAHQLLDISLNSFAKFQARLLPTIRDYILINKTVPPRIIFSVACLILFYKGNYRGEKIPLRDDARILEFAREMWKAYEAGKISIVTLVSQFLSKLGIDREIGRYDKIQRMVSDYMKNIEETGLSDSLPR